jgi:hypothetical protein
MRFEEVDNNGEISGSLKKECVDDIAVMNTSVHRRGHWQHHHSL